MKEINKLLLSVTDTKNPKLELNYVKFQEEDEKVKLFCTNTKIMLKVEFQNKISPLWSLESPIFEIHTLMPYKNQNEKPEDKIGKFIDIKKEKKIDVVPMRLAILNSIDYEKIFERVLRNKDGELIEDVEIIEVNEISDLIYEIANRDIRIDYFNRDFIKLFKELDSMYLNYQIEIRKSKEPVIIKFNINDVKCELMIMPLKKW